jgi:hypothetical protein
VLVRRRDEIELLKDHADVGFDRLRAEVELGTDRLIGAALGDQFQYRALALCQAVERAVLARPVEQPADDRGVQHALPFRDAPQGIIGQDGDVSTCAPAMRTRRPPRLVCTLGARAPDVPPSQLHDT